MEELCRCCKTLDVAPKLGNDKRSFQINNQLMQVRKEVLKLKDPARAEALQRFFKTGPGEYGEGDIFYGLTTPQLRVLAKKFSDLSLPDISTLLKSKVHEERSLALAILVEQFRKAKDAKLQEKIFKFYIKHSKNANNWDLVDSSAPYISGPYLFERDRGLLFKYAKSKNLWQRRIAILSTFYFIRQKDFKDSLRIIEILVKDEHDLIHKACGWMLREIGKRDESTLKKFLDKYATKMPRTQLRYAIEKFPPKIREYYLKLK